MSMTVPYVVEKRGMGKEAMISFQGFYPTVSFFWEGKWMTFPQN